MRTRLLASLLAVALLAACRTTPADTVTLTISDVAVPAQVAPAGQVLHLSVTAMSGGCVSYDHVDETHVPSGVTVRAVGIDHGGPGIACTADIRTNIVTVDIAPPFTNPVTVIALQPDGTSLIKVVPVR